MEKLLNDLVDRLTKTFDDRLASVVLYGSAATGDYSARFSDLNILCVLSQVSVRELSEAGPIIRWWRDKGNPSPLLLSEEELRSSTDCFPIEFHDIKERHRILYGPDLVTDLEIDESFYRAQVEYQLRSKLLRLRQRGAGVIHDKDLLLELLAESVSTFCVLARHALRLHGVEARGQKREIIEQAGRHFGMDPSPFVSLLDFRDGKIRPRALNPRTLYESYLKEIQVVVDAVDRLEK